MSIDKLQAFNRDGSSVIISHKADLQKKFKSQSTLERDAGVNDVFLYMDDRGNKHYGSSAFLNNPRDANKRKHNFRWGFEVKPPYGATLTFNPNKILFGCNFHTLSTPDEVEMACDMVVNELRQERIEVGIDDFKLSRIDVCKDIETDHKFMSYHELFKLLNAKHMPTHRYYENSYQYGNDQRRVIFYDKVREVLNKQKVDPDKHGIPVGKNIMRCEMAVLHHAPIVRHVGIDKVIELFTDDGYKKAGNAHRKLVAENVFSMRVGDDLQLEFDFTKLSNMWDCFREIFSKNTHKEMQAVIGLEQWLALHGNNREVIRECMEKYISDRQVRTYLNKELPKQIRARKIYECLSDDTTSIGTLYDELYHKLVA